jgi:lipopolysaccharide biosynthesis glycosyltransferase
MESGEGEGGDSKMIKIFIGSHIMHEKAEKALEWSIRKNTSSDVDITFTRNVIPWQTPPTGFSSHRYMIPKLCNFEGFAIHLDVDMLVLADIQELWDYQTPGKWCVTGNTGKQGIRDEVSVIDCSAFRDLPKESALKTAHGKTNAKRIVGNRYLKNIPNTWNAKLEAPCSKGYCADKSLGCAMPDNPSATPSTEYAKLIHYTNLATQPWHPNPNQDYMPFFCKGTENIFWEHYEEALREL